MDVNNMSEEIILLTKQNEVIINLLGRIAFSEPMLRKIITKRKRDPQAYIRGFNACDGSRTLVEIAKIIGVSHGTLSPILREWLDLGIIYEVEKAGGRFYKRIYPLSEE